MSLWDSALFFPHQVSIRARLAGGGRHSSFAESRDVRAEVIDQQTLVRDANGQEVVSSTRVTVPPKTVAPLGSLVTVWTGTPQQREAEVLAVATEVNPPPLTSYLVLSLK